MRHYSPMYASTLWTMLYLADLKIAPGDRRAHRSLGLLLAELYDKQHGIFSLGRDHFPVPCLNGNMLYLNFYFQRSCTKMIAKVIEYFDAHQRFDDGDFKRRARYQFHKSCYGKHTCMWGIVKLAKGLSFIPVHERPAAAHRLLKRCIDFILLHEVCFASHDRERLLHPMIDKITFPGAVRSDFLEILWILARERIMDAGTKRAIDMLKSRMASDGSWTLEHTTRGFIRSPGTIGCANAFVTERAREVLAFYQ